MLNCQPLFLFAFFAGRHVCRVHRLRICSGESSRQGHWARDKAWWLPLRVFIPAHMQQGALSQRLGRMHSSRMRSAQKLRTHMR